MADTKSKFDPSLFDEDDEFEEFPTEGMSICRKMLTECFVIDI